MFSCLYLCFCFVFSFNLIPPHAPFLLSYVLLLSGHSVISSYSGDPTAVIIFPLNVFHLLKKYADSEPYHL